MGLIKRKDGIDRCDITTAWYKVTKIFKGLLFLMIDTVNKAEELMQKKGGGLIFQLRTDSLIFQGERCSCS